MQFVAAVGAAVLVVVGGVTVAGATVNTSAGAPTQEQREVQHTTGDKAAGKKAAPQSAAAAVHAKDSRWTCRKDNPDYCYKWQRYDTCGSGRDPQVIVQNTGKVTVLQNLKGGPHHWMGGFQNHNKFRSHTVNLHPWSSLITVEYAAKKWKRPISTCSSHP